MKLQAVPTRILLSAVALGAVGTVAAQSFPQPLPTAAPTENAEESLPRYQIEVIAFAYNDFDPSEESFEQTPRGTLLDLLAPNLLETKAPDAPDPERLALEAFPGSAEFEVPAPSSGSDQSDTATATPDFESGNNSDAIPMDDARIEPGLFDNGLWYRLLTDDQLELVDEFERLELLDAYTPLVHGGWIQEGLPEEYAVPFNLSSLGILNPRGTIRLHVSRFLHVRVDLRYQPDSSAVAIAPRSNDRLPRVEFPPRYTLSVQRLTRSGELHFFDHPAFGVLVLVQPVPEEPETIQEELSPAA